MEKRNYTHIQVLLPKIKEMLAKGKIQREVAEHYGFKDKYVVKELLKRERRKERKLEAGILPRPKGRPEKDAALAERIAQQRERSFRTYGYRRLWLWLKSQNIYCNPKTVLRIMQKYDLLSDTRRRRKWQQRGQQVHKYKYLLNRKFHADTPKQKWVTDISYIHTSQGVLYLSMIRDLYDNIKSNKGSKTAGVDKIKMDKYLQMPKDELILLIQTCFRKYLPKPARREYIPKSNGKMRPLGIPTVLDRIIQECVRLIIEPICEAKFYPHSYGFRPYRAQKHAIRHIVNVINGGCRSPAQAVWAVEGDIRGCFDNINHRILLQKVWRMGIHDKRVLKIISQMLKAGYVERDLYHKTVAGTPQGGILSPLLSNIYLNDFDWYVGRAYMEPHRQCRKKCNDLRRLRWAGITPKYNFRYADD